MILRAHDSRARQLLGFALLFLAYQAPEALGQRVLESFGWQGALFAVFFVVAYAVGRRRTGSAARAYALTAFGQQAGLFAALFVVTVAVRFIALAVGSQTGAYSATESGTTDAGAVGRVLLVAVPMTFVPSIAEDMLTRGYLWGTGLNRRGTGDSFPDAGRDQFVTPFVLISATVYLLNHVFRLALGPSEWLMLFVFGAVYALALVRSGSLWPAVALHWAWNYANALIDGLQSVTTESVVGARLLSSAAHVVLAAIVIVLTPRRARAAE